MRLRQTRRVPALTLSADDAAALVRPVDTVGFGLGPANPHALLRALSAREDFEDLTLGGALLLGLLRRGQRALASATAAASTVPLERLYKPQGRRHPARAAGFRQFAPVLERFAPTGDGRPGRRRPTATVGCNLSLHFGATATPSFAAGRDPQRAC